MENEKMGTAPEQQEPEQQETEKDPQEPEKTYSQTEVDEIVQKRLVRERKKFEKIFNEGQAADDLEERERNVLTRELKADCRDKLAAEGLPYELADIMDYTDAESLEKSYKQVVQVHMNAVAFAVKDRLKGQTPRKGAGNSSNSTRTAFGLD